MNDFEKINSPFVRELRPEGYIVTSKIADDMAWVFTDESVIASEKLHGTCSAVVIENGVVVAMFNRTARIPFIGKGRSKTFTEAVNNAIEKDRLILQDGIVWGEIIGPTLNGNPYMLEQHEFLPFDWIKEHLRYKSWGKYPKTYEAISEWFKELQPLYCWKIHSKEKADASPEYAFVEGIVFHHQDGRMAKLRKDMFCWWKGAHRHKEEP